MELMYSTCTSVLDLKAGWAAMLPDIAHGLIVGVGVGSILALFEGIRKLISRREQIRFIRRRVFDEFCKIGNLEDPFPMPEGVAEQPTSVIRFLYLEAFLAELQSIATHRTGSMNEGQVSDLWTHFASVERMLDLLRRNKKQAIPMKLLHREYKSLTDLKWLNLPEKPPWD